MPHAFDKLVSAVAHAVVSAETTVRKAHLNALRAFFDEDHAPVAIDLKLASGRPGAEPGSSDRLRVPLLALVNPRQLSIEEMEVTLDVELGDLCGDDEPKSSSTSDAPPRAGDPTALGWSLSSMLPPQLGTHIPADASRESVGTVNVRLKIRAEPPPEGVARIQDRLNKSFS